MKNTIVIFLAILMSIGGMSFYLFNSAENRGMEGDGFTKRQIVNGIEYKMQYEPTAVKIGKAKQINDSAKEAELLERFKDHHYLTFTITHDSELPKDQKQAWADLSYLLKDEFRNQFAMRVNGTQRSCVLHHAFRMPQVSNVQVVQLVFKDEGFEGQADYFKSDLELIYVDELNRQKVAWSFKAEDLNKSRIINKDYNG